MVVLSLGVHFALVGLGVAYMKWGTPPLLNLTPVTTVDLVGFAAAPAPAEPAPSKPVEKPQARKPSPKTKEPAHKKEAPPARPGAMPMHDAKPDSREVLSAVDAMRARKAAETNAGKAIEEKRAQQELADRLKNLRDRAARQVNLSLVGPVTGGAPPSGRLPDAKPEELEYARALHTRVHDNWTQPVGSAKALVAVFLVKIQRDGYVPASGVKIYRTSGNDYFDKSVERAIMKASPLPIPPDQLRGGETYFEVLFNFYGSGGV